MNWGKFFAIWLIWACPALALAVTPPIPAQPSQAVVDLAGVMAANSRERLNVILKDLEDNHGVPVVVLTLKSLDGEALETISQQTASSWEKLKVNGVLLAVAVAEKRYYIEVGQELKAILPDKQVERLGKQCLAPSFNRGDYDNGIFSAATEIVNRIAAAKSPGRPGTAKTSGWVSRLQEMPNEEALPWAMAIVFLISVGLTIAAYRMGLPIRIGNFWFWRKD